MCIATSLSGKFEMSEHRMNVFDPLPADNHWAANGGPFTFPIKIRLTSVNNDTVYDTIPSLSGGQVKKFKIASLFVFANQLPTQYDAVSGHFCSRNLEI